jgi:hypothetical protein
MRSLAQDTPVDVEQSLGCAQPQLPGPGQTYYQRRRAQGDATGEAVRALKRRITRAVYQHLKQAQQPSIPQPPSPLDRGAT